MQWNIPSIMVSKFCIFRNHKSFIDIKFCCFFFKFKTKNSSNYNASKLKLK